MKKVRIELDNSDWGKVSVAVQHELNGIRNRQCGPSPDRKLRRACEVATMTRIKNEITGQRRAIRYGHMTDQSVSKLCDGTSHAGPIVRAQRQTDNKTAWIDGEYCESCRVYMFQNAEINYTMEQVPVKRGISFSKK